jgi:predicted nuclease of predicted toxin-antitoxin system
MDVAQYLRDAGHDVIAVAEVTPQAIDLDILAWAVREDRILVTNDKDFGDLVFRDKRPHRGIILFRLQDQRLENRVRVMADVLARYVDQLVGHFVVATEDDVRVRPTIILLDEP